jgi:hypothetical protein
MAAQEFTLRLVEAVVVLVLLVLMRHPMSEETAGMVHHQALQVLQSLMLEEVVVV